MDEDVHQGSVRDVILDEFDFTDHGYDSLAVVCVSNFLSGNKVGNGVLVNQKGDFTRIYMVDERFWSAEVPLPTSPGRVSMVVRNHGIVVERGLSGRVGNGAAAEQAELVAEQAGSVCPVVGAVMAEECDDLMPERALICVLFTVGQGRLLSVWCPR